MIGAGCPAGGTVFNVAVYKCGTITVAGIFLGTLTPDIGINLFVLHAGERGAMGLTVTRRRGTYAW